MPNTKLFLLDGHGLCYRSFYALPEMTNSKGQTTNAIYGFIVTLNKIIREYKPDYLAVCFDAKGKTLRQEKFADYKIQRPAMPEELRSQIPILKNVLKAFNISIFELEGYEADDLIATLSVKLSKDSTEVVIVADDKDMFQLADKNIKFLSTRKDYSLFGLSELKKRYGFDPAYIVDYIGLAGDSVDNIPGVKGIGGVNAKNLIHEYGDLESILKNLEKLEKPKKAQALIVEQKEAARMSRELAILEKNAPIQYTLQDMKFDSPDRKELHAIFRDLEFKRLSAEFADADDTHDVTVKEIEGKSALSSLTTEIRKKRNMAVVWTDHRDDLIKKKGVFIATAKNKVSFIGEKLAAGLNGLFQDAEIQKTVFDYKKALQLTGGALTADKNVFDVMLAAYLIEPSQTASSLKDLVWKYYQITVPEEDAGAVKAATLFLLSAELKKELAAKKLDKLFGDVELPLSQVLYAMESNGVCLDVEYLKKLSKETQAKINTLTGQLYKKAGEEFNINSPKQLSHILFEKLGLSVIKKTKTGYSTDESVLTTLALRHEFPALILEYRQLAKLQSTYIDALPKLIDKTSGRLHTEFNQIGAETGRLSSRHPNLQNIPIRTELGRQIRKAFIPAKESNILISIDYSQVELRILAHLSEDETLIKAFKTGQDIHNYTASLIFEVDEKDVTSDMRYATKRVNFGIIYGMSAFGLAKDLKIPQAEAQDFIDRYFLRYPKVKKFMDERIAECEKNGYVVTLYNRRRYIPEIRSKNNTLRQFAQRQAINTPVQGSAADLMKIAMINIQREIEKKKLKTKMLITVHDELVFDAPKSEKQALIKLARDIMEHSLKLSVPIKVSVKTGPNWLEMKEESS